MPKRGSDCTRIESVNTIIYYFNFGDEVIKFLMSAWTAITVVPSDKLEASMEGLQHGAQGAS